MMPLNHCHYYNAIWEGKFTYHKSGNSSQIDFILVNKNGPKFVRNFNIIDTMCHLSDHLPISIQLYLPSETNLDILLVRAMELNSPFEPTKLNLSHRYDFNMENATELLNEKSTSVIKSFQTNSSDVILESIEKSLISVMKSTRTKREGRTTLVDNNQDECDKLFQEYMVKMQDLYETPDNTQSPTATKNTHANHVSIL